MQPIEKLFRTVDYQLITIDCPSNGFCEALNTLLLIVAAFNYASPLLL